MKIWDPEPTIFVKIDKFEVSYFHEFATESYETSHIY